jgi:hypothetical protein
MKKSTNAGVLDRLLDPVSASLNEEAARKLVSLKADAKAQRRVATLARKCSENRLTNEERDEYGTYVMVGELVALLQAKARIMLARRGESV